MAKDLRSVLRRHWSVRCEIRLFVALAGCSTVTAPPVDAAPAPGVAVAQALAGASGIQAEHGAEERVRREYERRRAAAHSRMVGTMYASERNGSATSFICPALPEGHTGRTAGWLSDRQATVLLGPPGSAPALAVWPGAYGQSFERGRRDPYQTVRTAGLARPAQSLHIVPLFLSASDPKRQSLLRVVNQSAEAGQAGITAVDDAGRRAGPVYLALDAGETVHLSSKDLERGSPMRGLATGIGTGRNDWRLEISTDLELTVLSYVRTIDGFLTSMHDVVPEMDGVYRLATFASGRNRGQRSLVRLINREDAAAAVRIEGMTNEGAAQGLPVQLSLPGGQARTLSLTELEPDATPAPSVSPINPKGMLLQIQSDQPLLVMNLLESSTGHLSNLSSVPRSNSESVAEFFRRKVSPVVRTKCIECHAEGAAAERSGLVFGRADPFDRWMLDLQVLKRFYSEVEDAPSRILTSIRGLGHGGSLQVTADTKEFAVMERFLDLLGRRAVHYVPLLPSASHPAQQGIIRVVNREARAGTVRIVARDDRLGESPAVTVSIGASQTVTLSADDLEQGNAAKGLSGGIGVGTGGWHLELSSELDVTVLSYVRTLDGFLTGLHEVVPQSEGVYRVATFGSAPPWNQRSMLRLVNPGAEPAMVRITGVGDGSRSPDSEVHLSLPAASARTLTASELESGRARGLSGALRDVQGVRQLGVHSDRPLLVMNLLESPTGHLTNLSSIPKQVADSVAELFDDAVSPIVQSKVHQLSCRGRAVRAYAAGVRTDDEFRSPDAECSHVRELGDLGRGWRRIGAKQDSRCGPWRWRAGRSWLGRIRGHGAIPADAGPGGGGVAAHRALSDHAIRRRAFCIF